MCWTAHLHVLFYDSVRETSTKGTKNISHDCQNGQDPVWAAAIEAQISQKRASKVGCLSPTRRERQWIAAREDPVVELVVWSSSPKMKKEISFANS